MTRTSLKIGTWNILGRRGYKTGAAAKAGAVRTALTSHHVDLLCLQEVHFYGGVADRQLVTELQDVGLAHFAGLPLSDSHLDESAQLGVAIAARHRFTMQDRFVLTRPDLTARVRGQDWILHDKGMIGCAIDLGERPIWVYSLHLFPFFEFGVGESDDRVDRMWEEFWTYCDHRGDSAELILAGDFNHQRRMDAAARWSRRRWQFCFTDVKTTPTGLALDEIALNWSPSGAETALVPTFSDHHLAIATVPLQHVGGSMNTPSPVGLRSNRVRAV